MYKLLILDDEKPFRQAIQLIGEWHYLDIHERFEAEDAFVGLEIVQAHKPDIMLVDMKLPVISGIEFIRRAATMVPQAKYIVISGFDDFHYTQQAIQCQVLHYLLKPVKRTELNEVLQHAVSLLNAERKKFETARVNYQIQLLSVPLLKEKLFATLIEGSEKPPPILADMKCWLHAPKEKMIYGIAILSMINFAEICDRIFENDVYSSYFAVINIINELSASWNHGFCFRHRKKENALILVLGFSSLDEQESKELAAIGLKAMVVSLEEHFGLFSVASIGGLSPQIEQLHASFMAAEDILYSVNILQESASVFMKREEGRLPGKISILDKKDLLLRAFESGSLDYTRHILADYFNSIKQIGYFSVHDAHRSATEFMLMVEDIAVQLGINEVGALRPYFNHGNITLPITTFIEFSDFGDFVFDVIATIFDRIRLHLKDSEKVNLYKIKEYIDQNYNKEMKLSYFSDKYFLSKVYLSRLFKEEFQFGIYEYVLKVRMDKAKELLNDKTIRVQMIAEHLGYNDHNYFGKAFKKYYGMSPSDYRATQ